MLNQTVVNQSSEMTIVNQKHSNQIDSIFESALGYFKNNMDQNLEL